MSNEPDNDDLIVPIGFAIFGCCLMAVFVVLNAWGQIKGSFHYMPPPEFLELGRWLIGFATFGGTVGGVTAAIVSVRSGAGKQIEKKDDTEKDVQ